MPRPPSYRPSSSWTPEEDQLLKEARGRGLNWQPIADTYFPSKTANACRKRHERLMDREQVEEWDGIKLEQLAQAYQDCRREMWTILANRLDEKWTVVEAKCMEKGVKNLNAAARSAGRRRSAYDQDDSGGSMDGSVEWTPEVHQQGPRRAYRRELPPAPEYQHLQLPPPNVLHPPASGAPGPPIPSILSTPQTGYGQWYAPRP
ncbi:MAG: hypothetical protein Q9162_007532 [Coniocarpon cinnabarinum]